MSRALFIVNTVLTILMVCFTPFEHPQFLTGFTAFAAASDVEVEKKPIVITSQTLTADNKSNIAIFEGSVVATTDDITIYSDKMTVFYNNSEKKITKIDAIGNVKVHKDEKAIFSKKATYLGEEEKIIFTGNPKAVEGENVITGTQIIYFLKDDRVIVEGSRVVLQNKN